MLNNQAGFDPVYDVSLAAEVPHYSEQAEGALHLDQLHEDKKRILYTMKPDF